MFIKKWIRLDQVLEYTHTKDMIKEQNNHQSGILNYLKET